MAPRCQRCLGSALLAWSLLVRAGVLARKRAVVLVRASLRAWGRRLLYLQHVQAEALVAVLSIYLGRPLAWWHQFTLREQVRVGQRQPMGNAANQRCCTVEWASKLWQHMQAARELARGRARGRESEREGREERRREIMTRFQSECEQAHRQISRQVAARRETGERRRVLQHLRLVVPWLRRCNRLLQYRRRRRAATIFTAWRARAGFSRSICRRGLRASVGTKLEFWRETSSMRKCAERVYLARCFGWAQDAAADAALERGARARACVCFRAVLRSWHLWLRDRQGWRELDRCADAFATVVVGRRVFRALQAYLEGASAVRRQLDREREILAGTARLEWQRWSCCLQGVLHPWRDLAAATASTNRQISEHRHRRVAGGFIAGWRAVALWSKGKRADFARLSAAVQHSRARAMLRAWVRPVRAGAAADEFFVTRQLVRSVALLHSWNLEAGRLVAQRCLLQKARLRWQYALLLTWRANSLRLSHQRRRVTSFRSCRQGLERVRVFAAWRHHSRREVAVAKYLMLAQLKRQSLLLVSFWRQLRLLQIGRKVQRSVLRGWWQRWLHVCVCSLCEQEAELLLERWVTRQRAVSGVWAFMSYASSKRQRRAREAALSSKRQSRAALRVLCAWCEGAVAGKIAREASCSHLAMAHMATLVRAGLGGLHCHALTSASARRNRQTGLCAMVRRSEAAVARRVLVGLDKHVRAVRVREVAGARRGCALLREWSALSRTRGFWRACLVAMFSVHQVRLAQAALSCWRAHMLAFNWQVWKRARAKERERRRERRRGRKRERELCVLPAGWCARSPEPSRPSSLEPRPCILKRSVSAGQEQGPGAGARGRCYVCRCRVGRRPRLQEGPHRLDKRRGRRGRMCWRTCWRRRPHSSSPPSFLSVFFFSGVAGQC